MPWWLSLVFALGMPALKLFFRALERKYPGISPFIEAILDYLDGGGSVDELHSHCDKLSGFCPADLKRI